MSDDLDCPITPKPTEDQLSRLEKAAWDAGVDRALVWCYDRVKAAEQLEQSVAKLQALLKRIVIAEDCSDFLEHIASFRAARIAVGFKLRKRDDNEEREVLLANGYDERGEAKA